MAKSVDVKMDESAEVKSEAGSVSSFLPVGQSSASEPDVDTSSTRTSSAASEAAEDEGQLSRSESNDKPQLFMDDKREWIWSGKKGWFEAVVQYRIDQERRRLRFVLWRATEKGRPGRRKRIQDATPAPIHDKKNADDSATGYQWKHSSYMSTGFKSVKKVYNKQQQRSWWKKGRW